MTEHKKQKIAVFQLNNSGQKKISGILRYGADHIELDIHSITGDFPPIIDDGTTYLPAEIDADLVLDFLTHPDLSHDLVTLCAKKQIPVISSGKKKSHAWGHTPPTCCGLPQTDELGYYGKNFGAPEFSVTLVDGIILTIDILRGASCGATWEAARKICGLSVEQAKKRIGLETQFNCYADPANWDPLLGKSPVHFAGKIHAKALVDAIERALQDVSD